MVAEVLDLTVTWQDAAPVPTNAGAVGVVLAFRLTNIGNGTESYALLADPGFAHWIELAPSTKLRADVEHMLAGGDSRSLAKARRPFAEQGRYEEFVIDFSCGVRDLAGGRIRCGIGCHGITLWLNCERHDDDAMQSARYSLKSVATRWCGG